jgi:FlaA1/EpsC-like NDP-sugar epimerase
LVACDVAAALVGSLVVTGGLDSVAMLFSVVLVSMYSFAHLYRSRLSMSILDDIPKIVGRWLAAVAITILLQAGFTRVRWELELVKWRLVLTAAVALVLIVLFRAAGYAVVRALRKQRRVSHRTLVLGARSASSTRTPGSAPRNCRCPSSAAPMRSITCSPIMTSTMWSSRSGQCANRRWST